MSVVAKPNSFRSGPDERGRFGAFGGRFVAETLMPLILEVEQAYNACKADPKFQEPRLGEYLAAVAALNRFAHLRYRKDILALAVRWILDQGDTIALWGARRPDQLDPVGEVAGWSLDADAMGRIDRIVAEHVASPVGPEFMAPPVRALMKAVA